MSVFALARLRGGLRPLRLYFFARVRSTNDHAARLRRQGRLFAPAVVVSCRQTAGRGRGSNTWWSGPGVLTVTFVLPVRERLPAQELPLIAGLAVRDAAAELADSPQIRLKWPNDVLHGGRKLAGLLCERVSRADLIGVGLNVNVDPKKAPAHLRDKITSLCCIAQKPLDMTDVLVALAHHMDRAVRRRMEQPFVAFVRDYQRYDGLAGKRVVVSGAGPTPIDGICQGVDHKGRLVVRQRRTVHRIIAGTVTVAEAKPAAAQARRG